LGARSQYHSATGNSASQKSGGRFQQHRSYNYFISTVISHQWKGAKIKPLQDTK